VSGPTASRLAHRFSARTRRTEVRPIPNRRAISEWLSQSLGLQPDRLVDLERRRPRPAVRSALFPRLGDPGPDSLAQDLPLELGEDRQHPRHGAARWGRQVEGLGQRDKADAQVGQLAKSRHQISDGSAPAIEPPDHDHVNVSSAGGYQQ
jgi:hypothetical protein